jgi:hypothetical protein
MPRESIEQVRRMLEDNDDVFRPPKPRHIQGKKRDRRSRDRTPALLATTLVERWCDDMYYVFTRRFDVALGGECLIVLVCHSGDRAGPTEVLIAEPSDDPRIFWYRRRRAPRHSFMVDRGQLRLVDPRADFAALGQVRDRELVNALWPVDGPLRQGSLQ